MSTSVPSTTGWLLCAMATAAAMLPASATAQSQSVAATGQGAEAPMRDPAALAALDGMGQALRSLNSFSLASDASAEVVLDSGQKIELDGLVTYKVKKPDRLFVEVSSDRKQRQIYFDGEKLSVYAPRLKYYAQVNTSARTLGELAINAAEKYGIEMPIADMFFWGTEYAPKDRILEAMYVGPATLDAERVDQYAFRQREVDWQVWISRETSLPKQIVITSKDDPALPQYKARLHWDTRTPVDPMVFRFTPPAGAYRLDLVEVGVAAGSEKEKGS